MMSDQPRKNVISARGLAKAFGEGASAVHALRGVSFDVRAQEFLAIMGPSGSGKSTLLHLLGGMDIPTEGQLSLLDQSLDSRDDRALALLRRRRIGFVFQTFNLLPTLTAVQNVALPLLLDHLPYRESCRKARETLERLGMGHRLKNFPRTMSGGEQQRVAIARALVIEPTVILADEPTGNLDTENSCQILQALRRLVDEMGQTVVVVTHDYSMAECADRVLLLRDGQIAKDVTAAEFVLESLQEALQPKNSPSDPA